MESSAQVSDILASAYQKGVRLWLEDEQLRYRAPRGALTDEEVQGLKHSKSQIVAFLKGHHPNQVLRAPLTFSQLAHWNLYRLGERPAVRQIACATRLLGRLNPDLLSNCVRELVRRHDALRTRVVAFGATPMQEILKDAHCELQQEDLTCHSESDRQAEVQRRFNELILEPIDVSSGPLFEIKLLRTAEREHVLIMAMEHLISDAFSMGILLRELLTLYNQAWRGQPLSLPPISLQLADYALRQQQAHPSWLARHGTYWEKRLAGCGRLRFPDARPPGENIPSGWSSIPILITADVRSRLREWSRMQHTTLAMSVFAAYAALVFRWCEVSDMVVHYELDGRATPEMQTAIGYFAGPLYLRLERGPQDTIIDLLHRLTAEYCNASEHTDGGYIEAQTPRPDFARNTGFNWIPEVERSMSPDPEGSGDSLIASPLPFPHPMMQTLERDYEPAVVLFDTEEGIRGDLYFPLKYPPESMQRLTNNLHTFVRQLLDQPRTRLQDLRLL